MSKRLARVIYGALAGSLGAACMTVIRMAARRRGLIDKTIPQIAEEWIADRLGVGADTHPVLHHLADQGLHVAYGAALGAGYALAAPRRGPPGTLARGLAYGAATWFAGSWILLPLLRAKQAAWRKGLPENAVDLLAHLTFGVSTALVATEISTQSDRGPSSDGHRHATRAG
jgi:hypothetical protein